jgi:FkbM family methyltransferase
MTYSELGQDDFVMTHFYPEKRDGVFIEMGATDGRHNSNTLLFEQKGWTGLLVEPIPSYFPGLPEARPRSICVCTAIDTEEGEQDLFLVKEDTSPFFTSNVYNGGHSGLNKYYEKAQRDYVHTFPSKKRLLKVPTVPLQKLLDQYGITHVDYFSLDVEGAEEAVLRSIDWSKTTIDVITIEKHWENETIKNCIQILEEQGFKFVEQLGHDLVYSRIPKVTDSHYS